MLRIYIGSIENAEEIIKDIEMHFDTIKVRGTELDRMMIREIDGGEYFDETSFIDRFGCKLYTTELSTGCKAALCVANCPDKIIDLLECGFNARDAIICACSRGSVIIHSESVTIQNKFNRPIDVVIDKYRITNVDTLNRYIQSERPYEPEQGSEITCIE